MDGDQALGGFSSAGLAAIPAALKPVIEAGDLSGFVTLLWRKGEMSEDTVKTARREEAQAAADILGASVEFFDIGDYPMRADKETLFRLADVFRRVQPEFVLSHSLKDPYNYDHPLAMNLTQEARIIAQAEGYKPGEKIIGAPPVYSFEPHQPEQCEWRPDVLLEFLHLVADRVRRHAQLSCCGSKALMSGGSFKSSQAVERRQGFTLHNRLNLT